MSAFPYLDRLIEGRTSIDVDPASRTFDAFIHWGYWDDPALAKGGDSDFATALERLSGELLAEARVENGQSVLDAGCGFGGTLAAINSRCGGMRLTGVDIDPRQLEIAKDRVAPAKDNKLSWVEADACALPFPDGSFDRVLAVECIFHFSSRARFLKEAARVLKPGGVLALSDFVPGRLGAGGPAGRWLAGRIAAGYGPLGDWSGGDYRAMAAAAGLEVKSDRDVNAQVLPTYPIVLDLIRRGGMGGPGLMLWPTRWLYWLSRLNLVRYRILGLRKP